MGTQDSFEAAQAFLEGTGVATPTMLWDPSFDTWRALGVTTNSQMQLITPDLSGGSELLFGFRDDQQQAILDALGAFEPQ
ncbi:MAG: hypothetical protein V3V01_14115 [Acidimicrobiales bacterium]